MLSRFSVFMHLIDLSLELNDLEVPLHDLWLINDDVFFSGLSAKCEVDERCDENDRSSTSETTVGY